MSKFKSFKIKLDNNQNIEFKSAGICFYNQSNEIKVMLLKKHNKKWEFLGGNIDVNDESLLHTALREGIEESNSSIIGINSENDLDNLIKYVSEMEYLYWYPFEKFNYGLFFIRLPDDKVHETITYGDNEITENHKRTIHWLTIENVKKIIKNKKNLNFEVDHFILSNLEKIINFPEKCEFLKKWKI